MTSALYLAIAAPLYGVFSAGQTLYFASQGTGHVVLPVMVSVFRLLVVAGLGALGVTLDWPVGACLGAVAPAWRSWG